MDERELSLVVVGINYANADKGKSSRRFELELCAPGEPVTLVPEPKNKHDEYAVAVFSCRDVQIGYVPADRAPWIGGKIKGGEEYQAVFQQLFGTYAAIRVRFGGGSPTLPPPSERKPIPSADDFYPDPEGPEWGA